MGRAASITGLVLLLLAVGVAALFVLQNSGRTTQLSLDLYLGAWQLARPVSVMALVGVSAGVGFGLGLVAMLPALGRLRRRIRALETQAALGGDHAWK